MSAPEDRHVRILSTPQMQVLMLHDDKYANTYLWELRATKKEEHRNCAYQQFSGSIEALRSRRLLVVFDDPASGSTSGRKATRLTPAGRALVAAFRHGYYKAEQSK